MKKILFAIFGCFVALCAHAAQIVNVDYIHKIIQQEWDVTVPIRTNNIMAAANMKYLLTAIDVANEILNGEKTTDYGNGEFATLQAADTIATNQAVETLVRKEIEYKFYLTFNRVLSPQFGIDISAAGEFVVDWGDGTVETITKPDTTNTTYLHDYPTTGEYTIGIGGQATAYNVEKPAITFPFEFRYDIFAIDGSLGAIFSTLPDGSQPLFKGTFNSTSFNYIPENLFSGISGAPVKNMFSGTFEASGLRIIPDGLFAGISGAPAEGMFDGTFMDCEFLTGAIPDGLFGNLSGAPAEGMFQGTFRGCSGLTGAIPDGLFGNLTGAPASNMFDSTFYGCRGLTGAIPSGLFGNLTGKPAISMFESTFKDCRGLTGAIPSDLFAGISGAPVTQMFRRTFYGCSGLTGAIPAGLFGNLTGAPAGFMFESTFYGCSKITSIPENLFGNISGTAKTSMFYRTFYNCTSLTGPSARINGQYLYEIWPNATSDQVDDMYYNATGLSDYANIPSAWK